MSATPPKKSRVTVDSMLTIVSSMPVQWGQSTRLTALDHAMLPHSLHVIFYYEGSMSLNPNDDDPSLGFDKIRPSLCEVLTMFPLVTGRLAVDEDGKWEVRWTDAGVRMLRARVEATVEEWLATADGEEEMELVKWEDLPHDPSIWSPFRIQINEFQRGGVAIGLSCTHLLADPTSVTLFFKAWTEIHRRQAISNPPLLDLPNLYQNQSTTNTKLTSKKFDESKGAGEESSSVTMATATFSFNSSVMEHHLSQIHDKFPNATAFDFLTALFWTRIVHLKVPRDRKKESLSICTDIRKHLDVPSPCVYFRNALHFSQLMLDRNALEGSELRYVVEQVQHHMSKVEEEISLSLGCFTKMKNKYDPPFTMYGPGLTCVNMEHMIRTASPEGTTSYPSVYTTMFVEDVKPDHVSYQVGNVDGEGLILVMPSPDEGLARRVTVTLPGEQMAKLLEDDVILSLQPMLILSGRR
ncbi:hypothetical protein Droror1_Dr00024776 [Drosera rotundifolia]